MRNLSKKIKEEVHKMGRLIPLDNMMPSLTSSHGLSDETFVPISAQLIVFEILAPSEGPFGPRKHVIPS